MEIENIYEFLIKKELEVIRQIQDLPTRDGIKDAVATCKFTMIDSSSDGKHLILEIKYALAETEWLHYQEKESFKKSKLKAKIGVYKGFLKCLNKESNEPK